MTVLASINDRLAYDEPYATDASPHQYHIWLAQREHDNSRKRNVAVVDSAMKRFSGTDKQTWSCRRVIFRKYELLNYWNYMCIQFK